MSDWDTAPITLRKRIPKASALKSEQAVNQARRQGIAVDTQVKWGGGGNRQHVTTKNTAKLDRETEELKHEKVPLDLGKLIQQGRQGKGMSQKDLATLNIRVDVPVLATAPFWPHIHVLKWIFRWPESVKKESLRWPEPKVNEKTQVINDYEAGRGIPNQLVIGKIEKVLGVKLRGKERGKPLPVPTATTTTTKK